VQALNRTQPILPLAPGVPARQSHDYERHGVTSLLAAMEVASGVTIRTCYRRHRHQEFLRFLDEIEGNVPSGFEVHLAMDNYGTHKVAKVRGWLARHPRNHVHFTPTSGSWLNLVERLFGEGNRTMRPSRQSHCRSSAGESPARVFRPMQSESRALRLDCRCGSDPRQGSHDFLNVFLAQDTRLVLSCNTTVLY
jgi:DDE superfamily endonuclease